MINHKIILDIVFLAQIPPTVPPITFPPAHEHTSCGRFPVKHHISGCQDDYDMFVYCLASNVGTGIVLAVWILTSAMF